MNRSTGSPEFRRPRQRQGDISVMLIRSGATTSAWVLYVTWDGATRRDRLLARWVFPTPPDSEAARDPLAALRVALEHPDAPYRTAPPKASAPPQGAMGVVCPGQLRLDLPE
jgi:hypothetical protein